MPKREKITVTIIAIIIAIIMVFPLYWLITGAFRRQGDLFAYPPHFIPNSITLNNFKTIFELDMPFQIYFLNSTIVSILHVFGVLIFSSMAGFALAKYKFKGRKLIFGLIIGGMLIPFHSLLIPLFLINKSLNMIDTRAALIIPFLANPMGAFLMRQYITTIPDSVMESARIDGATEFIIYRKIILPLIKPVLAALAVIDFVYVWNGFVWELTILRSQSKFTLPLWLNTLNGDPYIANDGVVFAASLLTVLPIIIIFIFLQKYFVSGLALGMED